PMSVWLTPQGKPFYGGTYFPPDNRYGRPGFSAVLHSLARAWQDQRAQIEQSGAQVIEQLRGNTMAPDLSAAAGREALDSTFSFFRRSFDARWGGFGSAPKFPRPSTFNFLLRYYASTRAEDALDMVVTTLDAMA